MKNKMNDKDLKIINNIKSLGIDMINSANSGHPGIVLGAAPIIYTLFSRHLNINDKHSDWISRDRFILSAGHGSALLYPTLFMGGFDLTIDDLKSFRSIDSKTPGHPELHSSKFVEMTTGPLGQGFASAVGVAVGETYLNNKFKISKTGIFKENLEIFNYFTYVLCSDGDLMEGISYEAASLAGHLN